jgi:hypothetical protein
MQQLPRIASAGGCLACQPYSWRVNFRYTFGTFCIHLRERPLFRCYENRRFCRFIKSYRCLDAFYFVALVSGTVDTGLYDLLGSRGSMANKLRSGRGRRPRLSAITFPSSNPRATRPLPIVDACLRSGAAFSIKNAAGPEPLSVRNF